MYKAEAGMPVKLRRYGRPTTTVQANVSDECRGLLRVTTRNAEGWWAPLVGGETVVIYVMLQTSKNDSGLAQDFPFVVEPVDSDRPLTLVESASDIATVARGYGQEMDELFAFLTDLAAGALS